MLGNHHTLLRYVDSMALHLIVLSDVEGYFSTHIHRFVFGVQVHRAYGAQNHDVTQDRSFLGQHLNGRDVTVICHGRTSIRM